MYKEEMVAPVGQTTMSARVERTKIAPVLTP